MGDILANENKLREQAVRAARAKALLEDELFAEAFVWLEAECIKAWKASPARDDDGRQRIWRQIQALNQVNDYLRLLVRDGKIAYEELERLAREREEAA